MGTWSCGRDKSELREEGTGKWEEGERRRREWGAGNGDRKRNDSLFPDTWGEFEIPGLLPGPYTASVILPQLAPMGITVPTALRFTAHRDSVHQARVRVARADAYADLRCHQVRAIGEGVTPLLKAEVVTSDGRRAGGVNFELSKDNGVPWQRITELGKTDGEGRIHSCMLMEQGDVIHIRIWRDGETPRVSRAELSKRGIELRLTLPESPD